VLTRHWNHRKYGVVHSAVLHAKMLLRKLSAISVRALKNIRQPCSKSKKFEECRLFIQTFHHNGDLIDEQSATEHNPLFIWRNALNAACHTATNQYLTHAPDQSHFGHGIVQCSPTFTSIQDLFQRNCK